MDAFVYKLFKILIYEPLILALTYVAKTTCTFYWFQAVYIR